MQKLHIEKKIIIFADQPVGLFYVRYKTKNHSKSICPVYDPQL